METRSRANKKVIPVIVKEVEKSEPENNMYKDYNALQGSLDKLHRQEEEINRLIKLNTNELGKFRSLYFKNKKKFNKCKDNNCWQQSISVTWKGYGTSNSYVSHCEKCKSFYLRELVPDYWGENRTYKDI
jgi:hypothetical protein